MTAKPISRTPSSAHQIRRKHFIVEHVRSTPPASDRAQAGEVSTARILSTAPAHGPDHQVQLDDRERRIEQHEADRGEIQTLHAGTLETERKVGSTPSMVQGWRPPSATIQPSSAAIQGSGKRPAGRSCRNRRWRSSCAASTGEHRRRCANSAMKKKPSADHDAEAPEQRRDRRHGVERGGLDLRRRVASATFGRIALQQQRIAEIVDMRVERVAAQPRSSRSRAQALHRAIGDHAAADALSGVARPAR